MCHPRVESCGVYIVWKSFRIQIKWDVSMQIFMTQSEEKNSAYQWKDQDSFKVRDVMVMGCIFLSAPFLVFTESCIAWSLSVLRRDKSQ